MTESLTGSCPRCGLYVELRWPPPHPQAKESTDASKGIRFNCPHCRMPMVAAFRLGVA